jgi:phosphatidylglycerophosphate synthase
MRRASTLGTSITLLLASLALLETAFIYLLGINKSFTHDFLISFSVTQLISHVILWAFLMAARPFFHKEESKNILTRVNLANIFTIFRLSILPTSLFLIIASRTWDVMPFLAGTLVLSFLSDALDGFISRKFNQKTYIGRILDSVSDYSLLFAISVVFRAFQILPLYLFIAIILRFTFQALGMTVFLLRYKYFAPKSTIGGKITVATVMLLFIVQALKLAGPVRFLYVAPWIEYAAGTIILLSTIEKAWGFYRTYKQVAMRALSSDGATKHTQDENL